ncbi:MAG: glycosyltransferase family 2 protein [Clostridia bacterium]|nr:glycosyltransferase family 2 protein [Clostridia bacterium]
MNDVKIEILLASFQGARFIREQIDSILHQQDTRWHLTVSDDGSTDGTTDILDAYVQQYPHRISRVRSGQRFGHPRDHFFWLIQQCDAPYMMTCDQDDVWHPDKVGKTLEALCEAEKRHGQQTPILVFADQTPTDDQLTPLAPSLVRYQNQYVESFDYRSLLIQNVVTGCAMGFNRALADLASRCADSRQVIMHDWWMAVVAARFGQVVYIDQPLSDYRQHGDNSVGAQNVRSLAHKLGKLGKLAQLRAATAARKAQAGVFCTTYKEQLNDKDMAFLTPFTRRRSGVLFCIRYRACFHGWSRMLTMVVVG